MKCCALLLPPYFCEKDLTYKYTHVFTTLSEGIYLYFDYGVLGFSGYEPISGEYVRNGTGTESKRNPKWFKCFSMPFRVWSVSCSDVFR